MEGRKERKRGHKEGRPGMPKGDVELEAEEEIGRRRGGRKGRSQKMKVGNNKEIYI